MRYTKDGLSVNKTEKEAQLSEGIQKSIEQGGIIESPDNMHQEVAKLIKLIRWITIAGIVLLLIAPFTWLG